MFELPRCALFRFLGTAVLGTPNDLVYNLQQARFLLVQGLTLCRIKHLSISMQPLTTVYISRLDKYDGYAREISQVSA